MNGSLEHRECSEALGAFALEALPPGDATRVGRHVEQCNECRGELERLRAGVEALPAGVPLVEPPPELKTRIMAVVQSEARLLEAAGPAADRPPRRRKRWRWGRPSLPVIAAGVASVAAAAVAAAIIATSETTTRSLPVQIASPALVGVTRASLQVRDTHAVLSVSGLPVPAPDRVDQLWVQRPGAVPEPAGAFVLQTGAVAVQRPVRRGDIVMLTVESRGTRAPTMKALMIVRV